MINENLYRGYRTRTFSEVFDTYNTFSDFYTTCGIETTIRHSESGSKTNTLRNLYYLLLAKYANSHIASSDESRFKYNTMAIIFQYGPTWEKNLEIQKTLREASENDLVASRQVFNTAENPETSPGTSDTGGIGYVNRQTVAHSIRNKIDAYSELMMLLKKDVTGEFLDRFKNLFTKFSPEVPEWYKTEMEDTDNDN